MKVDFLQILAVFDTQGASSVLALLSLLCCISILAVICVFQKKQRQKEQTRFKETISAIDASQKSVVAAIEAVNANMSAFQSSNAEQLTKVLDTTASAVQAVQETSVKANNNTIVAIDQCRSSLKSNMETFQTSVDRSLAKIIAEIKAPLEAE